MSVIVTTEAVLEMLDTGRRFLLDRLAETSATIRLRVDGDHGTVEILDASAAETPEDALVTS